MALALDHVYEHGGRAVLLSCIRAHRILDPFNAAHGTHHQSQERLIQLHRKQPTRFPPANPVALTSHCWFSDGSPAYRDHDGNHIEAGHVLPWDEIGIDLDDAGKANDNSHFLSVARHLGYGFVDPYGAGSEKHHGVFNQPVVPILERWNVIDRRR